MENRFVRRSLLVGFAVFVVLGYRSGCSGPKDPRDTDGVVPGDSCRGIGPQEGLMTCDDALENVLFCSSFTEYTWVVALECDEDETCWHNESKDLFTCMPD